MRIAITADVHLTTTSKHPERHKALENILQQAGEEKVRTVIIAGDLFDVSHPVYSEFETLCQDSRFRDLRIYVIPGNHDLDVSPEAVAADNVEVIVEPRLLELDDSGLKFLLVPYNAHTSMGEQIAPFVDDLTPNRWILVGHGDWAEGLHTPNPYEPGVYMPLTRKDIEAYQPTKVFLGHVHVPSDHDRIHYPGSPHPIDITETGYRRFLLFDTKSFDVESRKVETDVIYFDAHLVVLPVEDEKAFLQDQVSGLIKRWAIDEADRDKVQVRVTVSGYSSDRKALTKTLKKAFSPLRFYDDSPPDISGVHVANDVDRNYIAEKTRAQIEAMDWPDGPDEPARDEILLAALHLIYGS